jgi:hypothetical protein
MSLSLEVMLLDVTLVSFFLIPYFKTFYADGLKTDQVFAKHAPVNLGPAIFLLLTCLESE